MRECIAFTQKMSSSWGLPCFFLLHIYLWTNLDLKIKSKKVLTVQQLNDMLFSTTPSTLYIYRDRLLSTSL